MFDFIGDIHGHAPELKKLLIKLGYSHNTDNVWEHESRKAFFLGDYIDRGSHQKETIEIVRSMVRAGNAVAIMGNHEFNAVAYSMKSERGNDYLRPHNEKNYKQHKAFLNEYEFGSDEYREVVEWFKTLPIYIETDSFRAIHACWNTKALYNISDYLNDDNTLKDEYFAQAATDGNSLYTDIEILLKGLEVNLPNGESFKDKDGITRRNVRCKWWDPCLKTFKECAIAPKETINNLPHTEISEDILERYYGDKPVFFGHYWYVEEAPKPLSDKAICLDYSVGKDEPLAKLACYRFDGENELSDNKTVWINKTLA
jgi:hypothetical protein